MFKMIKALLLGVVVMAAAGCASRYQDLPVREGTVKQAQHSMQKVFTPSVGGAAGGAAIGGLAANRIGKGSGRKWATAAGILAGGAIGAKAAGEYKMVPYSLIVFQDNHSLSEYRVAVEGHWQPGMLIRYSVDEAGQVILR